MFPTPDMNITCPREHVVAYLAGFFDGEGCVRVGRTKGTKPTSGVYHHLELRVNQRYDKREPLLMLQSTFGGSLNKCKPVRANCCPMASWALTGPRAAHALQVMLPYLLVKRPAAYAGLAFAHWKTVMQTFRKPNERVSQFELDVADGFMKVFYTVNGNKPIDEESLGLLGDDPKEMVTPILSKDT